MKITINERPGAKLNSKSKLNAVAIARCSLLTMEVHASAAIKSLGNKQQDHPSAKCYIYTLLGLRLKTYMFAETVAPIVSVAFTEPYLFTEITVHHPYFTLTLTVQSSNLF